MSKPNEIHLMLESRKLTRIMCGLNLHKVKQIVAVICTSRI